VSVSVLKFNVEILFNNKTLPHANVLVWRESVVWVLSKVQQAVNVSYLNAQYLLSHALLNYGVKKPAVVKK
jgi:hypothetical protein